MIEPRPLLPPPGAPTLARETPEQGVNFWIAEAVLRELYLVPFEACVREAGAFLVMAAYN